MTPTLAVSAEVLAESVPEQVPSDGASTPDATIDLSLEPEFWLPGAPEVHTPGATPVIPLVDPRIQPDIPADDITPFSNSNNITHISDKTPDDLQPRV